MSPMPDSFAEVDAVVDAAIARVERLLAEHRPRWLVDINYGDQKIVRHGCRYFAELDALLERDPDRTIVAIHIRPAPAERLDD